MRGGVQARLHAVNERITKAARLAGRDPASIALVAVSKAHPTEAIREAAAAGQRAFAENYVQEAVEKIAELSGASDPTLEWHFIGPIQSNKTRAIAEHFDWVQSVDRLKIAQRLSDQRPADTKPLNVLLQVNISDEASKSGVLPDGVEALADAVSRLPRMRLRGLMTIPEPMNEPTRQRAPLAALQLLFERLRARGHGLDTLSMGMSADLEAAILEGATMLRIGTAIFGEREARQP